MGFVVGFVYVVCFVLIILLVLVELRFLASMRTSLVVVGFSWSLTRLAVRIFVISLEF